MPEHVANSKTRRADDFERCRLEITSAVNCRCNETTAQVDTCVQAKLGQFSLMNWQVNSSQSGYRFSCSSIPCPPPTLCSCHRSPDRCHFRQRQRKTKIVFDENSEVFSAMTNYTTTKKLINFHRRDENSTQKLTANRQLETSIRQ